MIVHLLKTHILHEFLLVKSQQNIIELVTRSLRATEEFSPQYLSLISGAFLQFLNNGRRRKVSRRQQETEDAGGKAGSQSGTRQNQICQSAGKLKNSLPMFRQVVASFTWYSLVTR